MTAREYYKKRGVDLSKLPEGLGFALANNFLEQIYFTKEKIEKLIQRMNNTSQISINRNQFKLIKGELIKTIKKYLEPIAKDKNYRFKSWEHCYKAFDNKKSDNDIRSLHLAFYLASWGMYRGSSGLLWKDYKIHMKVIKILDEFKELRRQDVGEFDPPKIIEVKNRLTEYYSQIDYNKGKSSIKKISATDTLISKILLGTLGCVPAFDRYFNLGFNERKTTLKIDETIIKNLQEFVKENKEEIEKSKKEIFNQLKFEYPTMKIIDMYFWQKGYEKDK